MWDLPAEAHGSTEQHMAAQGSFSLPDTGGGGATQQTPMGEEPAGTADRPK